MSRDYSLNTESAKKADRSMRISETGKYTGHIVHAIAITASTGTEGMEVAFEDEGGGRADYLTLWTFKEDGTELSGLDTLNAIMTCTQQRDIKPVAGTYEKWDKEANEGKGGRVQARGQVYPGLAGKKIGFLLQKELGVYDGKPTAKMLIYMVFDAASGRTASEILGKKVLKGEQIDRVVLSLKDKHAKGVPPPSTGSNGYNGRGNSSREQGHGPAPTGEGGGGGGGGGGFVDDDIPFMRKSNLDAM